MNRLFALTILAFAALPAPALASQGGPSMPWDVGVQALVSNVQGPLASAIVIGALCLAGILWAVTEHQTGMRRLSQGLFGGAVAIGVVELATSLNIMGALV